ncbi:hypothetical protein BKA66DRAFT_439298 [Pyrenochaeta sp. MPI-SDFR-AT-0127]|nr:hypothetical protein BKA66DRAFT_439298 [Pyrenochaeta sp. MPI-SDFR-AT-0127]
MFMFQEMNLRCEHLSWPPKRKSGDTINSAVPMSPTPDIQGPKGLGNKTDTLYMDKIYLTCVFGAIMERVSRFPIPSAHLHGFGMTENGRDAPKRLQRRRKKRNIIVISSPRHQSPLATTVLMTTPFAHSQSGDSCVGGTGRDWQRLDGRGSQEIREER